MSAPLRSCWIIALLLAGCWGNEATVFPAGLEPLGDNPVDAPPGTVSDPYPEQWALEGVEAGRYDTVYARGYIRAPIVDVWTAFRDPIVGTDRRSADEWTFETLDDPAYDESYIVHATTYDIITVDWSTTWRHGVVEGTVDAPELVAVRWQKTAGSTILRLIEGSLVLRPVGDGSVTELDIVYHVNATGAGIDDYRRYIDDMIRDAIAVLRGDPLPVFD